MRVYFISNNGVFPDNDTIDIILQGMFEDGNITSPSCTYVGCHISNSPEKLIEDIDDLSDEFIIIYYNQDVGGWRILSDCETDQFMIDLKIEANYELLTGEILMKIIDNQKVT